MPEDFVGVPKEDWLDLRDQVAFIRAAVLVLAILTVLIVWALARKGVLASPLDLLRMNGHGVSE